MSRNRLFLIAALALCAAIVAGLLIGKHDPDPYLQAAQQRCEQDVLGRLASPATATLSGITIAATELDPETTDLSALTRDTLKSVDRDRIEVRTVAGVVQAPNAFGDTLNDTFTCRAYFVDGNLADTLVVFEHDH